MASIREAVMDALVAALQVASVGGTTKPAGLTVHRMRTRPIAQDSLPAIVVWLAHEQVTYETVNQARRRIKFWAECRVAHPGVAGDVALDPLLVWATKALMADIELGGLTSEVDELQTVWELTEGETTLAKAAIEFDALFDTAHNDPETQG